MERLVRVVRDRVVRALLRCGKLPSADGGGDEEGVAAHDDAQAELVAAAMQEASLDQPAALLFTLITPGAPIDLSSAGAYSSFLYLNPAEMLAAYVPGDNDRLRELACFMPYVPSLQGIGLCLQWHITTSSLPSGWATSDMALTIIN